MKNISILTLTIVILTSCDLSKYKISKEYDLSTTFEKSNGQETGTYQEVIDFYTQLDDAYTSIEMKEVGTTDSGKPLHLVIYNPESNFDWNSIHKDKTVLLINNGIHPGESDGIDATMMMLRDFAQDSLKAPKNTVIATIPIYNVGGSLTRNSTSRTNQNGPKEYGFRGNARNYDLNRDFIKMDSKNAFAFAEVFHQINPDVFIDNHVSNGADYQYTLTHLLTQHDKLGGPLGKYLKEDFMIQLEDSLAVKGLPITPYVNVFNEVPEKGFSQFLDNPRYSTGYTTLWNTLGLMIETHMLKPYSQRVESTYELMITCIDIIENSEGRIKKLRTENQKYVEDSNFYPINYTVNKDTLTTIDFKGYEAENLKSEVTQLPRLKYNKNKPFNKEVSYYDYFQAQDSISIPKAYVIPQGWWPIKDRLLANQIEFQILEKDSLIEVETYRIKDFETLSNPYEGHYLHKNTSVTASVNNIKFRKGDLIVPTHQAGMRYLLETLEPSAVDSFFNWNFFDSILQQKEGFSPYVFEEVALRFLQENPSVKKAFEAKKTKDKAFRNSWYAQLDWIHKKSPHYEKAHLLYPVFRMLN
ncbi:M14 family metallopeptidase [Mesonia sp. MT50]|uniref:M14 family metallopeptidase n=1 Tax=Mesonia profundi TaxID=3070998 RepID=A0ABU0ZZR0_9FLAO|nr:M14 family metallopeptidase [Mesonia profundi]MDQ7916939.1 M14 family metallopeptidase [Mesonia profundi]